MIPLTDRQRREIAVLPRILWSVCRQDGALVEDGDEGSIARLRAALDAVQEEAFAGLYFPKDLRKAEDQITKATRAVIVRAGLEDQPNAKIVAAVWQVFAHLIEHDELAIHDGSPMADVVAILEPAHAHVYESPALARSAAKRARKLLDALHAQGLWTRVPAIGEREVAV
ncbi:hypothetical protein ACTZWW_04270 [Salinarimonas sp. NSM]|uniref:hypothetical protein n=1 Tax=Salinarimonas sp. NSM TaxID=3458003 RepID=UPI00403639F8